MATDTLHMTIAAADGSLHLAHEMRLLKAGLLYADEVSLYSIKSEFILGLLALGQVEGPDRIRRMREWLPHLGAGGPIELAALDQWLSLTRKKHRSTNEIITLRKLEAGLNKAWTEMRAVLQQTADEAGVEGLLEALDSGVVTIGGLASDDLVGEDVVDSMLSAYVKRVESALNSNVTYPLFDELTANHVVERIRAGELSPSHAAMTRGKQAGVARYLFDRLPSLERLPVSRILELRSELEGPLTRFRRQIILYSGSVESAAWDRDFAPEAEQLARREVEPTLLELEDAIKSNSLVRNIVRELSLPGMMGTSAIGLGVARLSELSASVGAVAGVSVAAATATAKAWDAHRRAAEETHRHGLYFYYRVGQA